MEPSTVLTPPILVAFALGVLLGAGGVVAWLGGRLRRSETARAVLGERLAGREERVRELAEDRSGRERQLAELGRVGELLGPLAETLDKVERKIDTVEQSRREAHGRLSTHLESLSETHLRLQGETGRLVQALRAPAVRGRWGEMQLQRVVELAGMVEHCDFEQQVSVAAGEGRSRPDLVVRLAGGGSLAVDAKAPLHHFLEALETEDEDERRSRLADHARLVRRHVMELAGRAYWESLEESPELVVLFLPGETFFGAALEQDPALLEFAAERRVLLATPTTLIALLKAVAWGWRQEQQADNARAIARLGRELHGRLGVLVGHFESLRRGLEQAVAAYNRAVGSFESRVAPAARRFEELGATTAELPPAEPVDKAPRPVAAGEEG